MCISKPRQPRSSPAPAQKAGRKSFQPGYHIMSKDGKTNWTSTGLAYQAAQSPPNSHSNWLRYTDGTVNVWHNMERVGVVVENGHPTHFTFAVTDVNKNASGVNQGGSKVLVVPFNGVQFDCDNGDQASCEEAAVADAGADGSIDAGGVNDGAAGKGGGDSSGMDATASGGADGAGGVDGAGGGDGAGGPDGSGGTLAADAGGLSGDGSSDESSGQSGGCGCKTAAPTDSTPRFAWLGGVLLAGSWIRRRRRAGHAARLTLPR
jgi:MYXO-CTERM domain-containing protein